MPDSARHPRPKAVLFDLDDTLWPIAPVIVQAEHTLFDWLARHAPRVVEQYSIDSLRQARLALLEREPALGVDLGQLRRTALHAAFEVAGEDTEKVAHAMTVFLAARNAVIPFPDVLPGLRRLQGQVLLGSVTNGNADLRVIGLAQHFQTSVAAPQFGRAKPDPTIFHAACAALGIANHEAVYVGDDLLLDVQGAQQAGMRAVWMNRNASQHHLTLGVIPDAIVANLDELIDWLVADHT